MLLGWGQQSSRSHCLAVKQKLLKGGLWTVRKQVHSTNYLGKTQRDEKWGKEAVMKLASYFDGELQRIGVVDGKEIWDLRKVMERYLQDIERISSPSDIAAALVPYKMADLIRVSRDKLSYFVDSLEMVRETIESESAVGLARKLDEIKFLPPTESTVICCGSSYRAYMGELGFDPTHSKWPSDVKISFLKHPNVLIGH